MTSSVKVDIFIRSYKNDFEWLKYCLRSIKKFCKGFNDVHVAVPNEDVSALDFLDGEIAHGVCDKCEGYLAQQVTKMYADNFCNADYILHVDSDCIFFKETHPEDFFEHEKPIVLYDENVMAVCPIYSTIRPTPWPEIAKLTLGWFDEKEYMRRLPIIYPRWIYPEFRKFVQQVQKHDLETWICAQPYRQFSEFNTLGQWANRFHNDKFTWLKSGEKETCATQHWSWGGVEQHMQKIEQILK
jgi:hypothetical protein